MMTYAELYAAVDAQLERTLYFTIGVETTRSKGCPPETRWSIYVNWRGVSDDDVQRMFAGVTPQDAYDELMRHLNGREPAPPQSLEEASSAVGTAAVG